MQMSSSRRAVATMARFLPRLLGLADRGERPISRVQYRTHPRAAHGRRRRAVGLGPSAPAGVFLSGRCGDADQPRRGCRVVEETELQAISDRSLRGRADAYLVAHAHAHGHTVVTLEQPSDGVRMVKIPNACVGLGVKYINTFELLRREGARFMLSA